MSMQSRLDRLVRSPRHTGAALAWARGDGPTEVAAAGDIGPDTPFFAASATKLLVTALLAGMQDRLPLDTPFRAILDGPETARLHYRDGQDRTGEITLRMLMAHTSGLADYFQSASSKSGLMHDLLGGADRAWRFEDAMETARRLGPLTYPGDRSRARYSDTNFQVLGRVIETVEGAPLDQVMMRRLFAPLGLRQTWIYADPADTRPRVLRYRDAALSVPLAMASFGADGSLVTTATEGVVLTRALFSEPWLSPRLRADLSDWRPMWFPIGYGTGMMRFALPRVLTLFRRMPPMIGHSGLSGAVLFHAPDTGLTVAGTVNQIDRPGTVFRLMAQLAMAG